MRRNIEEIADLQLGSYSENVKRERSLRFLLVIPLLLLLASAGAIVAFNAGIFHSRVEHELRLRTGAEIRLGAVKLDYTWPPRFHVGATFIQKGPIKVQWKQLDVLASTISAPYDLRVNLVEPQVEIPDPSSEDSSSSGGKAVGKTAAAPQFQPPPVRLKLDISNGMVTAGRFKISSLGVRFEQKLLLRSPLAIQVSALVEDRQLHLKLPVTINGPAVTLSPDAIKAESLTTTIGGISADLKGGSLLNEDRHRWNVQISVPDLAKLPKAPVAIPAKNLMGAIQLKIEAVKPGPKESWQADGEIHLRGFSAYLDYSQGTTLVRGPLSAALDGKFQYHGGIPVIPELSGKIEMPQTALAVAGIFEPGVVWPIKVEFAAKGDAAGVKFEKLDFQFSRFSGLLAGNLPLAAPWTADFNLEIKPVALDGLEKQLTPVKSQPVKGEVAMKMNYQGSLFEPAKAHITLNEFKVKNFAAQVQYEGSSAFKLSGPVSGSVEARAEVLNGQVKSAAGFGSVNLKAPAIVAGPMRKEAGQELSIEFQLKNLADKIQIEKFKLNTFVGRIDVTGEAQGVFPPAIDLHLNFNPLSLTELRNALPTLREKIPQGTLSGDVRMKGVLDTAGDWNQWPLEVAGQVFVRIPEYKLPASPPATPPSAEGKVIPAKVEVKAEPFLPTGNLTSKLDMKVGVLIEALVKDNETFKAVKTDGRISEGQFRGNVAIGNIFDGQVKISALEVPLLDPHPVIEGKAEWTGLTIEKVLQFAKPEFKEFASGKMTGAADFQTHMPAEEDFMKFLKAKGRVLMQPVVLNTLKMGQMINDLLKKVPLLRLPPAKVTPMTGKVEVVFSMQSQAVQIAKFQGVDVDGSEISFKGKVQLPEMQGDLIGDFFWANPPIKGCLLEGNADAQGRLDVPLSLRGDLMKPQMAMLTDLASKLGGKALKCESQKLVEKAKTEGKEKLEKELKKKLGEWLGGK